jgi:hypothetical protein
MTKTAGVKSLGPKSAGKKLDGATLETSSDRWFMAEEPAAIAVIREFHVERQVAIASHRAFVGELARQILAKQGQSVEDPTILRRYEHANILEQDGYGRLVAFSMPGPAIRDCLPGWQNPQCRTTKEILFSPASDTVKAQIAALPTKQSCAVFFKRLGWKFLNSEQIVALPQYFVIGKEMCGFAVPRAPLFGAERSARLVAALGVWKPNLPGFVEIPQARYDLALATYKYERLANAVTPEKTGKRRPPVVQKRQRHAA